MSIKDMVKDGKTVSFVQFREGNFIYQTEDGFEFPVPLSDIGNATMLAKDKAIMFMRYIRKHIELQKTYMKSVGIQFEEPVSKF
jgi:hypothetical protein